MSDEEKSGGPIPLEKDSLGSIYRAPKPGFGYLPIVGDQDERRMSKPAGRWNTVANYVLLITLCIAGGSPH